MEIDVATKSLGALAQESRLKAFRLLVRAGNTGMPAGLIAKSLGIPHNTMSNHLAILSQADLLTSTRSGTSIAYAVNFESIAILFQYLLEDCCQGRPEVCQALLDTVLADNDAG